MISGLFLNDYFVHTANQSAFKLLIWKTAGLYKRKDLMKHQSAILKEKFEKARMLETDGGLDAAVKAYSEITAKDPNNWPAYNRLMLIYRKQKAYKQEIEVIKEAISHYEAKIKEHMKTWTKENGKTARLSRALAKSLGQLDAKGIPVYEEQQVINWKKRLAIAKKKLKT